MSNEPRDYSGALFKNARKEKDTHPDYNGTAMINGVHMWVSAWIKESSKGVKYMSLAFKKKDEQRASATLDRRDDLDEEIPF